MTKPRNIKWTAAQLDWIKANQHGISRKELLEKLKGQFDDLDPMVNLQNITNFCKRKRWSNGFDGKFKIKHTSKAKTTGLKKQRIPHNKKPVGSERRDSRWGYIIVKVAEPNKWEFKHKIVWEKKNGKVPKGHILRFLDNNPENCNIDNLICIPRQINARINKNAEASTGNKDINKAVIQISQLNQLISELEEA